MLHSMYLDTAMPLGWQARAASTRAALRQYADSCKRGDFTPIEQYAGFHQPYNDLSMAIMHGFFPFPFAVYSASQRSKQLADRVLQHPWVLAGGTEAGDGEVYQSK